MQPPTDEEISALVAVLRKKVEYQRVDLYGEPLYGRSLEVELYIVEDWLRQRLPPDRDIDQPVWSKEDMK